MTNFQKKNLWFFFWEFVKRIQKRVDGKLDIISDNKDYPKQVLEEGEINVIGKIAASFGNIY